MEGSADLARFLAKPVTREIDRMPAVIHQHAAAGDGGIAPPVRMIRIGDRAILDAQCFNLNARSAPMAPERNISVARLTIGAYFQLWTGTTARPDSFARLRAFSSSTKSKSSGFSQRTFHSRRERIEHRLAVQCRWRANIDKIDLSAGCQFLDRGKCRDAWQ